MRKNALWRGPGGLVLLMAGHVGAGGLMGRLFPARGPDVVQDGAGAWIDGLAKPGFYPPGWAFPVAWTALYLLMGLALWLMLRAPASPRRNLALTLYGLQMAVNLAFSPLFFGLESLVLGVADTLALAALLAATLAAAWGVSRAAVLLLLPYAAWTGFAALLAVSLWRLNG